MKSAATHALFKNDWRFWTHYTAKKPVVVIAPVNAITHTTLPTSELRSGYDTISVGQNSRPR